MLSRFGVLMEKNLSAQLGKAAGVQALICVYNSLALLSDS